MRRRIGARWARTARPTGGVPRRWAGLLAVAAVLVAGSACRTGPALRAAGLERFTGCDALARYLQGAALERVGPYGLGGSYGYWRGGIMPPMTAMPGGAAGSDHANAGGGDGSKPAPSPDYSGTNVQEAGVDEPDVVKNDGRRLLSVVDGRLHIVDLAASPPRLAGSLALAGGDPQLLQQGNHVLVISSEWQYGPYPGGGGVAPPVDDVVRPGGAMIYRPSVPRTRLSLVDIADPAKPAVRHSIVVDGRYVDARFVGGRARVVTSAGVPVLPFVTPTDGTETAQRAAQKANETVVRRTTANDWLPKVRPADAPDGAAGSPLVPCDRVSHPPVFSGFDTVSVLSLDLGRDQLDPADTVGVTASAQTVYASTRNLYVATQATTDTTYTGRLPDVPRGPVAPVPAPDAKPVYEARTALHAFDVSGSGAAAYRGSGTVDGGLLDQWSLSEQGEHLRVVTTTGNGGCGGCAGDQSHLSVLRLPTGRSGSLTVVGTVGGMGKGEAVKAVRFIGDRAYVVTFRQVDPFYVVDLSDPTRPAVVGELKAPGYSAYLHPVGDGRLLGVGRDATPEGRVLGTKVALYDVTDPAKPAEVRSLSLPDTWTSVEQTAKAFLWWAPTRLAAVPVVSYAGAVDASGMWRPQGFTGVIGLDVNDGSMTERGRVANEPAPYGPAEIARTAVAGDRLLTVSANGVRVSDLTTLAPRTWVPFPVATPDPGVDPVKGSGGAASTPSPPPPPAA
jgi:uncharacterized secreted protein with C-terminal beta-propeller domain